MPFGGLSKTSDAVAPSVIGLAECQTGASAGIFKPEIDTWSTFPPAVLPAPVSTANVDGL
jgi:hypothetical protein